MTKRNQIKAALEACDDARLEEIVKAIRFCFRPYDVPILKHSVVESLLLASDKDPNVKSVLCGVLNIPTNEDETLSVARRANAISFAAFVVSVISLFTSAVALYVALPSQ